MNKNVIVGVILGVLFVASITKMVINKKKGKKCCTSSCVGCSYKGVCEDRKSE